MSQRAEAEAEGRAPREEMVDRLVASGAIASSRVEEAFRAVPRHLFLPDVPVAEAYRDDVIFTKQLDGRFVSASSQPTVMAMMLEQLDVRPGHRVLEVGAGTGYNAALLAHLAGPEGRVTTVDIDADIVEGARRGLERAGCRNARAVHADGGLGVPEDAPYDRLFLAVSAWEVTPAWREQLGPTGRMVLPLSIRGVQKSVAFERDGEGLASVSLRDCRFVGLRGAFGGPETALQVGPEPGVHLLTEGGDDLAAEAIEGLLAGEHSDLDLGLEVTPREFWSSLRLWLALHEPGFRILEAEGAAADGDFVPRLHHLPGRFSSTAAVLAPGGLAVLAPPPGNLARAGSPEPFSLHLRSFGSPEAAERLAHAARAWDGAARPGNEGLVIRVRSRDEPAPDGPGTHRVEKGWSRLLIGWRSTR
jgi:protein-L-isoaspartate(D-aspartate) O-methyltransferase